MKKFTIHVSRYTGFGFPVIKGQLIMFFFQKDKLQWLCNGPILIR